MYVPFCQNTDTTVFVRGMGLALLKNGNTTQVCGITPRGDVSKLMSQDGVTDYTYTAYGEPTSENTSLHNPFGYTGEYTDAETGLVYLRNRYYDPEIGIFITIDPAKDGLNWYAYCAGNPIAFVDPWGFSGKPADDEVYLREMFNMYKQSNKDKIDVYNNRVVVKLNNKQQTYYYDTETKSVHGSRVNDGRIIVDAVDFAKYFELVKYERNDGSEDILFSFIDKYAVTTVRTTVSWRLGVSFVLTPDKTIVTSLTFALTAQGWATDIIRAPKPYVQQQNFIIMKQGNKEVSVGLKPQKHFYNVKTDYYSKYLTSDKRVVFRRGPIHATAKFTITNNSAQNPPYSKTIEQNFGYYK